VWREGHPAILANYGGSIYALSGICNHQYKPLEGAQLWDHLLDCPWHHFQYDVRSGESHFPKNVYPHAARAGEAAENLPGGSERRRDMGESGVELAQKHCVPCRGGVPPLKGAELLKLAAQLPDWKVVDEHHITKTFQFPDFQTALAFVNRAGAVAEAEGHHPDLTLTWGRVDVTTYTHKIDGLTESDFILAAKIDQEFFRK
jgi:4a-hydroxytetrahydrobiopterin dehydratase